MSLIHLESYSEFRSDGSWKKRIYDAGSVVGQDKADSDTDLAREIVNDVVAHAGKDDFFLYCRSKRISIYASMTKPGGVAKGAPVSHIRHGVGVVVDVEDDPDEGARMAVVDWEGGKSREVIAAKYLEVLRGMVVDHSRGAESRMVPITELDFKMHHSKVRDMASTLQKYNDELNMVIDEGKPHELRLAGRPTPLVSQADMDRLEGNKPFREGIASKYIGRDMDLQMSYRVWVAPGRYFDVVNMEKTRITDIEVEIADGPYLRVDCVSPFGQPARIDLDRHSPTEFKDLEANPTPEGALEMVATGPAPGADKYPSARHYLATPGSWETTAMLRELVEVVTVMDKRSRGEKGQGQAQEGPEDTEV